MQAYDAQGKMLFNWGFSWPLSTVTTLALECASSLASLRASAEPEPRAVTRVQALDPATGSVLASAQVA